MGSIYPTTGRLVVLLLLVTTALAVPQPLDNTPEPPASRWYIHVVNGLSDATLFVHCKSGDDDLGFQNLVRGADFKWTFRVNVWNTTLYWCFLRKPGATVSFESFWTEHTPWLHQRCSWGTCIWTAKDDGIYLKHLTNNVDELVHKWLPSQP